MRLVRPFALLAMTATLGGCPWMFFGDRDHGHDLVDDTAVDDGPDDDGCDERLKDCLASGRDPQACQSEYDTCAGATNGDPCADAFDACILSGQAPEVCEADYRACVGGEPSGDPCDEAYQQCLLANEDPAVCAERLADCQGGGEDPVAACDRLQAECLALGLPDDYCAEQHDACVAATTPDPCESLYATCVELGLPESFCADERAACQTTGDTDAPADTGANGR